MFIESMMPSNHLILCPPRLLLPSIFPSISVLSKESVLCIRWPSYWSFSFSISPSNEYSGLFSWAGWTQIIGSAGDTGSAKAWFKDIWALNFKISVRDKQNKGKSYKLSNLQKTIETRMFQLRPQLWARRSGCPISSVSVNFRSWKQHDAPNLNALTPFPKQEHWRAPGVQAFLNFKTDHDHSLFLTFPSPRLCLQAAFLGRECLRPHWQIWVPGHAPAAMGLLPCPPTPAAWKPAFRGAHLRAAGTMKRVELKSARSDPGVGEVPSTLAHSFDRSMLHVLLERL